LRAWAAVAFGSAGTTASESLAALAGV
jgi:hypothetical protein